MSEPEKQPEEKQRRSLLARLVKGTGLIVLSLIGVILVGVLGFYAWIKTERGTEWLTAKVEKLITEKAKVRVEIGEVDWTFPLQVSLNDIHIWDAHDSIMLVSKTISLDIGFINMAASKISVKQVTMDEPHIRLHWYKGESGSNLMKFISALEGPKDTTKEEALKPTTLFLNEVVIRNGELVYDNENQEPTGIPGTIDVEHTRLRKFNGVFTGISLADINVEADIKQLSLVEDVGFEITNLTGHYSMSDTFIEVSRLRLVTPNSVIGNMVRFDFPKWSSWGNFYEDVDLVGGLKFTKFSMRDLRYFTNGLVNTTDVLEIDNADVSGPVGRMRVNDFRAQFGNKSKLDADVYMTGLPDAMETYFNVTMRPSLITYNDVMKLLPEARLPDEVRRMGDMRFNARFSGFPLDFVTTGNFSTAQGDFDSDLRLDIKKPKPEQGYFKGAIKTKSLNLGAILANEMIGRVTMDGSVEGTGLTAASLDAKLKAEISSIGLNKYDYHNLVVDARANNSFFDGTLSVDDRNLDMDFRGKINYSDLKMPIFDFKAEIYKSNLSALGLVKDTFSLKGNLELKAKGIELDDIEGHIKATEIEWRTASKSYELDSIIIESNKTPIGREILIESALASGHLKGNYKLSTLPNLLQTVLAEQLGTNVVGPIASPSVGEYVDFDMDIHDLNSVMRVLDVDLKIGDSTSVAGRISTSPAHTNFLKASIPWIQYTNISADSVRVNAVPGVKDGRLDLKAEVSRLLVNNEEVMRDGLVEMAGDRGDITWRAKGTTQEYGVMADLNGKMDNEGNIYRMTIQDSSSVWIDGKQWRMRSPSLTVNTNGNWSTSLIELTRGRERLAIVGRSKGIVPDSLKIMPDNINLAELTGLVPELKGFEGELNGDLLLRDRGDDLEIESSIMLVDAKYDSVLIGTLVAQSKYDESKGRLSLNAIVMNDSLDNSVEADGYVGMGKRTDMNVVVKLNESEIALLEPFLGSVFTEMRGKISANVRLSGERDDPMVRGNIDLIHDTLKLAMVETKYIVHGPIALTGRYLDFKEMPIKDIKGHSAVLKGKIDLANLGNPVFDLALDATKETFMVMDKQAGSVDVFYGKVFATGTATVRGDLNKLKLDIYVKTEANSDFNLQVGKSSTFSSSDFIRFVDTSGVVLGEKEVNIQGVEVKLRVQATPECLARIIFDPRVGDRIEARGSGLLNIELNTEGDLAMSGEYIIQRGSYLFTAFDIINKNFELLDGGRINWTGDPFDAKMDVTAVYKINNVPVRPLLNASQLATPLADVNASVDTKLKLTNSLLTPEIYLDFDVKSEVTTSTSTFNDLTANINLIKADEQERNKQVVSLLLLQSFAPLNTGLNTGSTLTSGVNTGLGDLVSNQLNYWLSQLTNDVQLGVNVGPNDDFILKLNTTLFKGKVKFSGTYDVNTGFRNIVVDYPLSPTIRASAFNRTNISAIPGNITNTIGTGLRYRKSFDTWDELWKKMEKPEDKTPKDPKLKDEGTIPEDKTKPVDEPAEKDRPT